MKSFDLHDLNQILEILKIAKPDIIQLPINILDQKLVAPHGDHLSYTVSKFALEGATRALSRTIAPTARINAVSPGHTLPSPEQTERGFHLAQSQSPLGYGPIPEDIAQTVLLYFSFLYIRKTFKRSSRSKKYSYKL